jgi:hypothetical protein
MNLENVDREFLNFAMKTVWDSVVGSVRKSVKNSVWKPVRVSVGVSVLDSVDGIQDAIREERFNNEAAQKNIFF